MALVSPDIGARAVSSASVAHNPDHTSPEASESSHNESNPAQPYYPL